MNNQQPTTFYLSQRAIDNLRTFRYRGEDQSYLYNAILSPFAAFLVNNCTPAFLAPNIITLLGLCCMIASYASLWYYAPRIETPESSQVPGWIFVFHAWALLVYQTLDNMDGKQARRTGSSTPLGLLFDHGCDAVNSIFGSAGWILGLGLSWDRDYFLCLILIFGPFALFFAATWEEYHTGELILPTINGPSEGLVGAALLSLVSYFHPQFWQSTTISDSIGLNSFFTTPIRNADIQVFVASLGIIRELVVRTFSVTRKYGIKSLTLKLPFWIFVSLQVINRNLWITLPRTALHLSSAIFVENVTQLMMNHVTDTEYSISFRYAILIPVALLMVFEHFINLRDIKSHLNFFDCSDLWIVYTTILWTYLFCKFRLIVHEICLVLDIQCFHISKQTKQK